MSVGDVMTLSPSRKRSTPDDDAIEPATPFKVQKTSHDVDSRESLLQDPQSPALSVLSDARPSLAPSSTTTPQKSDVKQTTKRRTKAEIEAAKLQRELEKAQKEAEKQAKQLEKEEKRKQKELEDRQKEEERQKKHAEKEEERLKKEEERLKKQAEKDAKQQQRDQERAAKEAEKQKRLEEQQKKERAQLRMSAFFVTKTPSSTRTAVTQALAACSEDTSGNSNNALSDYESTFLPFSVPKNGKLAPVNFFTQYSQVDSTAISPDDILQDIGGEQCLPQFGARSNVENDIDLKELVNKIHGSFSEPIDLTSQEYGQTMQNALACLNQNLTYLEFHEDVRPPFCGLFTKSVPTAGLHRVKRNPTQRKVKALNYEYDSEAEWEEPEEGEDILGDEDDDESDDGDDDMEEFIDDEGNIDPLAARRPAYARDVPPVSSGLQWQEAGGKLVPAHAESPNVSWSELEICFTLVPQPTCVDPFSSQYWELSKPPGLSSNTVTQGISASRPALTDKTRKMNGVNALAPKMFKITKTVPPEDLDAFKAAILGQELTKIAMREHLKKLFPKLNKEAINNTLDDVAERESKKATAKWRLK